MANWTRQQRTVTYIEYLVPRGSYVDDWYKAIAAAEVTWNQANGPKEPMGDWCQIDADDENIIIRITVEKVKPS